MKMISQHELAEALSEVYELNAKALHDYMNAETEEERERIVKRVKAMEPLTDTIVKAARMMEKLRKY